MKNVRGLVAALCFPLSLLSYGAQAALVPFNLVLNVDFVAQAPAPGCLVAPTFGCTNSVLDVHIGTFFVDEALLAVNSLATPAGVSGFLLTINGVTWDQENPSPTGFAGFRNSAGMPAPSFDVDVFGGTITDVHGGVFSSADVPFVDFSSGFAGPNNAFFAQDVPGTILGGTLTVSPAQVNEPSVLLLLIVAFGICGALAAHISPHVLKHERDSRPEPMSG